MKQLFIGLLSLWGTMVYAQQEQTKMLKERLPYIDTVLQQAVGNKWTAGAEALIIRNGAIAYHKTFGFNDIETGKKLEPNSIYRIASQTKAITSVAIMILYEEGKLLLDDPVSKFIPSFKNPRILATYNPADTSYTTVPAKKEITIRHLLTHTSGIAYAEIGGGPLNAIYRKHHIPCGLGLQYRRLSEVITDLGTLPLAHEPGTAFTYGLNVDVLGYIVELLSGMSLSDFFQKRIFVPLDMQDTYFYLPKEKNNRLVNLYIVAPNGQLRKSPGYFEVNGNIMKDYPTADGSYYAGGAGLVSTVMDYAKFLQMLLNDGTYNGKRILSRNTIRMMTMNQIGDLTVDGQKFGLGFRIVSEAGSALTPQRPGTFSWGGAFSTQYWVDPKEKLIGILYRQLWDDQHEEELNDKYKILVYQALAD